MDKELRTHFRPDGCLLRAWREDDIDAAYKIVLENTEHLHRFMRWMTPDYSIDDAKKFIHESIKDRLDRKRLELAIISDGELIGSIGLNRIEWGSRNCEIGYWIDYRNEGKGVITKACRALVEYVFDELGFDRIEIRCSNENVRSMAVANRLGFTKEGCLRRSELIHGRLHDLYIYGILADDPRLW